MEAKEIKDVLLTIGLALKAGFLFCKKYAHFIKDEKFWVIFRCIIKAKERKNYILCTAKAPPFPKVYGGKNNNEFKVS